MSLGLPCLGREVVAGNVKPGRSWQWECWAWHSSSTSAQTRKISQELFTSVPLQPITALLNPVISISGFRFHSADELTWYKARVERFESSTAVNFGVWPVCPGKSRAQGIRWISLQKLENKTKKSPQQHGVIYFKTYYFYQSHVL